MKNKTNNRIKEIDNQETISLFEAYGILVRKLNYYTFRLTPEDSGSFFDWFFTKGTLMKGAYKRIGTFTNPEDVALVITKNY